MVSLAIVNNRLPRETNYINLLLRITGNSGRFRQAAHQLPARSPDEKFDLAFSRRGGRLGSSQWPRRSSRSICRYLQTTADRIRTRRAHCVARAGTKEWPLTSSASSAKPNRSRVATDVECDGLDDRGGWLLLQRRA